MEMFLIAFTFLVLVNVTILRTLWRLGELSITPRQRKAAEVINLKGHTKTAATRYQEVHRI